MWRSARPSSAAADPFDVRPGRSYTPRLHSRNYRSRNLEVMANTKSAQKATRVIERRTAVNKARRSRMRSSWRSVEEAIAAGDAKTATAALKQAEAETMRAVSKGVVHKNLGSRKVSRLTRRIAALSKG